MAPATAASRATTMTLGTISVLSSFVFVFLGRRRGRLCPTRRSRSYRVACVYTYVCMYVYMITKDIQQAQNKKKIPSVSCQCVCFDNGKTITNGENYTRYTGQQREKKLLIVDEIDRRFDKTMEAKQRSVRRG